MYDILRTIEISAKDYDIDEVTEIKLVIGNINNILPDALRFAFDSFKGNPPLAEDAKLILDERLPEAECKNCGEKFVLTSMLEFSCPVCGENNIKLIGGEELYIEYYKGREKDEC
jgi:hydrogenase nickel incorporation protein HypA/HybF